MRLRSSPDHRAAVLRRFSTSGFSLAAFCRQEGLACQSVLAWRKAHGYSGHAAKAGQEFVSVE
jgi:transposase-like protein